MEALSCFIKKIVSGGFLKGCQARGKGGEGVNIFHLLFANDISKPVANVV